MMVLYTGNALMMVLYIYIYIYILYNTNINAFPDDYFLILSFHLLTTNFIHSRIQHLKGFSHKRASEVPSATHKNTRQPQALRMPKNKKCHATVKRSSEMQSL
jgi:hypothetical protein